MQGCRTDRLSRASAGTATSRTHGIGDEETEHHSHGRPGSHENGSATRPHVEQGLRALQAEPRGEQARDDDEDADDAYDFRHARPGCYPQKYRTENDAYAGNDIERIWSLQRTPEFEQ